MRNRKCPKCKKNTAEQSQGGITGGIWYQQFKCTKCENIIVVEVKDWKHLGLWKTEFSHINTINTPFSISYGND